MALLMGNGNGDRSKLYLNIIMTLCAILLAVMSWVMKSAVERNDLDHIAIKAVQGTKADRRDIERIETSVDRLVDKIGRFIESAPPPHVHLNDGRGSVHRTVP